MKEHSSYAFNNITLISTHVVETMIITNISTNVVIVPALNDLF